MVLLALAALARVFLVRPAPDDGDPGRAPTPQAPTSPSASPSLPDLPPPGARPPSTEAFCGEFRNLADAQAFYTSDPDQRRTELVAAADRLVRLGVPREMGDAARGGYYALIRGIYESVGLALPPRAVPGALPGEQVEGADQAFSAYLTRYCPA